MTTKTQRAVASSLADLFARTIAAVTREPYRERTWDELSEYLGKKTQTNGWAETHHYLLEINLTGQQVNGDSTAEFGWYHQGSFDAYHCLLSATENARGETKQVILDVHNASDDQSYCRIVYGKDWKECPKPDLQLGPLGRRFLQVQRSGQQKDTRYFQSLSDATGGLLDPWLTAK
jgi:hypothetical protein